MLVCHFFDGAGRCSTRQAWRRSRDIRVKCPHCTAHLRFEKNGRDSKPDDPVTCYFHGPIGTRQTVAYAVKNRALEMVRDWQYNETAENLKQRLPDSEVANMPFDDVSTAATPPGHSVKCPHCTAKLTFEKPSWHRTPNDPVTCYFHGTIGTRLGVSRAVKSGELQMVSDRPSEEGRHAIHSTSLTYAQMKVLVKANNKSGLSDDLIIAIAWRESSFTPSKVNPGTGTAGLLQLSSAALKDLMRSGDWSSTSNVFDPAQNIAAGSLYLANRIKHEHGNLDLGLDAFGTAPGYSRTIMEAVNDLQKYPSDPMKVLKRDIHT